MSDVAVFPVHVSMEEWTALLRLVRDNVESLEGWDDETREFWERIEWKLSNGPVATA